MVIGNNRKEILKGLEEKMSKRVDNWIKKRLSWAGKEVLIKSCLQSILLYNMGCFKFPRTLCNNMCGLVLNFWWNGDNKDISIHWIRKDLMQKRKLQGGLGCKCFESLNIAMWMKQLWRFLTHLDLLISKIFKQKYLETLTY